MEVRPGGTLWFVFIGHGAPAQIDSDGLLVAADVARSKDGLSEGSLSRTELVDLLGTGQQSETVLVLDAAFSGKSPDGTALVDDLPPPSRVTPELEAGTLLSAAEAGVAGPLHGTARPAFSYLVLGALRGWGDLDQDGEVTAAEATSI